MCIKSFLILSSIFCLISLNASYLFAEQPLITKIEIPYNDSLVRADVPVFGKAYGNDFKEFILDYGEGKDPKGWTVINRSNVPQLEYSPSVLQDTTSFGKTIDGNLGTWKTGLDEYKYGEHPVNLSGIYILRLRTFDNQGNVVEDKITVEVGRIILNSIGGSAQSKDGLATLEVNEHSLYTSALLVSLKALDKNPFPQDGLLQISKVYELREPNEKFTQPVILKIQYDSKLDPRTLKIYSYDTKRKIWQLLDTKTLGNYLYAQITQTPPKFALYAIFSTNEKSNQISPEPQASTKRTNDDILFQNDTLEEGTGEWHTKYSEVGAKIFIEKKEDGTNCLKLTNQTSPSNFSSSIITEPFNAKDYPLIKFSYKIPADLKINFQIKTGGKWHEIVFTGAEKIYWDVNMDKIGEIEDVVADNNWHTAYFNIYEMLEGKTDDFVIQELTMADWDITGFMKLELGHNKKDAVYYIDNFTIAPSSSALAANAWKAFDKKEFETSIRYANAVIDLYKDIVDKAISSDVATCNFIIADILKIQGKIEEAKAKYRYIARNYPSAKCWDPRGWYWNVADVAKDRIFTLETGYDFGNYTSEYLTNKAWEGLDKKEYKQVEVYAQKCILLYEGDARSQQGSLKDFAKNSFIPYYWSLNNVGTCYFILGESYLAQKRYEEAKKMYREVIDNYAFARCWDKRGWFWKVSDSAKERLEKLK